MTTSVEWGEDPPVKVNLTYKFKSGTRARWIEVNPVLGPSEPGHETDTGKMKLGNGISRWLELPYVVGELPAGGPVSMQDLNEHIEDVTPHPAYDSGPNLNLLYENAKV